VLEVGAGFGRFTFQLLDRCGSVVAIDIAPRALERIDEMRVERDIAPARCVTRSLDVTTLEPHALGERFRAIVGFFVLHHLPDPGAVIRRLAAVLEPGGFLAFIEPNRRNPLFLAQVACCADMTWADEKGMLQLSGRGVAASLRAAGLEVAPLRRFGFFPPQLYNRSDALRRLEARLEKSRALEAVLPFLLLHARAPLP
jgi:SAM-dependent methyltransferase